jgi:hypothetical protein
MYFKCTQDSSNVQKFQTQVLHLMCCLHMILFIQD